MPVDIDKLSKERRDWLEVFGNQWKMSRDRREPMTDEEKQALQEAVNPFSNRK
jgi:hypothetical protein